MDHVKLHKDFVVQNVCLST